jgi:protein-tyrosine phosphatase
MVRICFVCLGNICRSPTAEAVMKDLVAHAGLSDEIHVESAGTGDWHVGDPPDPRSVAAGKRRGFVLGGRARHFDREDWERFEHVLALDKSNYADLRKSAPPGMADRKLRLLRSFDPSSPRDASVPDPYYTADGFDEVIDLCLVACEKLLDHVREAHGLRR